MNDKTLYVIYSFVFILFISISIMQTITDKKFISKEIGVSTDSVERIFFTFTNSKNGWTRTYEVNGKVYLVNGIFSLDLYY